jgi:hypothetical protein
LNLIDSLKEPETFEDIYYHPNHEEMIKWRKAISKEFDEMKEKGVCETILKLEFTIKMYGFKSSGNINTCEQCVIAKA